MRLRVQIGPSRGQHVQTREKLPNEPTGTTSKRLSSIEADIADFSPVRSAAKKITKRTWLCYKQRTYTKAIPREWDPAPSRRPLLSCRGNRSGRIGLMRRLPWLVLLLPPLTSARQPVRARHAMVVTVEPYATDIGVDVLKSGGNAIDAAVAVGFALAVTHPSAANLAGGAL